MIHIVSFAEARGGAARAANNFYSAISLIMQDVFFVVVEKKSERANVLAPVKFNYILHFIKRLIAYLLLKLQASSNSSKHSLNLFSCHYVLQHIEKSDLVHLNWINNETIAVDRLPDIASSIIITLHDEWLYSGTEHYALDTLRVIQGYSKENKNGAGIDWDRRVWLSKKLALNAIKNRLIITAPSKWILNRAQSSALLKGFDIRLLPNIVDTEIFKPRVSILFKYSSLENKKVILFGAVSGKNMYLKGFNLLLDATYELSKKKIIDQADIIFVSFGGKKQREYKQYGFKHVEVGSISDAEELSHLYSLARFTVVPSIAESFGQVAAESLACETPVVCFNCSGLVDIVKHKESGFLAEPFSSDSLVKAMEWMLAQDMETLNLMGLKGRTHIIQNFSKPVITQKLQALYTEHMGMV